MPAPRTGRLNLSAVLSNPHPTIDLHLPADRASLRNFSHAIADFTSRSCAMAEISQRREVYTTETRKLAVRAQDMENETNQCKQKEIELISGSCRFRARALSQFISLVSRVALLLTVFVAVLEREREKTKEVESSIAALRLHLASQQRSTPRSSNTARAS